MPTCIPSVCKNPRVRFPSTWKDARGKPLTDKAIEQYIREGFYGPDLQRRQALLDKASVHNGVVMLARPCCVAGCKALGNYMAFAYLPQAGYYCDSCRTEFKQQCEKEQQARRRWSQASFYE